MSKIVFLLFLIAMHIFADYNLQGWLASAKQKEYWKKELHMDERRFDNSIYANDYKCALLTHCIQWAFHLMFIVLLYSYIIYNTCNIFYFLFVLVWNIYCHYIVDDKKANDLSINLIQDQLIHLLQIIFTWLIFV